MSSLLALQTKETVVFASDTALSTNYAGIVYRVGNNESKLFDYPKFIMFASGRKFLRDRLVKNIGKNPSISKVQKVLQDFILPDSTEFSLEIVIAIKKSNKLIFLSSTNDFVYKENKPDDNNTEIFTAGYKTNEIADSFIEYFNSSTLLESIAQTYKKHSCDEIGGSVDIFILTNGILTKQKINIDKKKEFSDKEIQGELFLVHAERLVGRLILGNKLIITDENGTFTINGNLLTITDPDGRVRVRLGEYKKGKYGLQLFSKDGNQVVLDEDGMLQTWQEGRTDNVDINHPLELYLHIPKETISVRKVKLRFKRLQFRAYSSTTSGGGGMYTATDSGGGMYTSTDSGGGLYTSTDSGGGDILTSGNSGVDVIYGYSETETAAGHRHVFRDVIGHKHYIDLPDHTHSMNIPSHSHSMNIPSHSHNISIPDHSHEIEHGIFKGSMAGQISVYVNGTDVGGRWNADRDDIEIGKFMIHGYDNKIEIFSNRLGRIDATVFAQVMMGFE